MSRNSKSCFSTPVSKLAIPRAAGLARTYFSARRGKGAIDGETASKQRDGETTAADRD